MELNFNRQLIAYASAFASFIIPKINGIKEIILFGSSARGEADKESDIDLFFNIESKKHEKQIKDIIEKELKKFYTSKIAEQWTLKNIKNPIKVHVGILEEWGLKRSIISEGITLYGKYKELPENLEKFCLFNIEPIKNISKRNRIIRKLFGRAEKNYSAEGIITKEKGKKLSPTSFIVSKEYAENIIKLLGKEKINYKFFEIWSDQIIK